ncbi:hypothetical protein [Peijinzhouia sedimentorum]
MEPLSSFAISIAAGIVLEYYNKTQGTVKNELKKAFEKALKLWCVHPEVRDKMKSKLKIGLKKFIDEPELLADLQNQNPDLYSFFEKYNEALPQFTAAYNYVKWIRDLERYRTEVTFLSSIKDTVEDTNRKLTDYIESNFPESTKLLEEEWKRQIAVYKESISSFKPKTALNFLLKLEESFASNNAMPSSHLLSSIEFLKAQCYELIGNPSKMYKSFIRANNLNSSTIQLKEKACYSYAKTGESEKSNCLVNEILKHDEFNSMAWAVKIILDAGENLESLILATPQVVRSNWNFKRLVYFNLLNERDYKKQIEIFNRYNFLTESYDEAPLTLSKYKKALFVIEITLSRLFRTSSIEYSRNQTDELDFIKKTNKMLGHFLEQMWESEIITNFQTFEFCYYFTEFVLTDKRETVHKMRSLFRELKNKNISLIMIMANSLQLIGEIDEAIKIINEQESKSIETIHLESYCYLKKSEIQNYIRVSKDLLTSIKKIDLNSIEIIVPILYVLYENNRINDIDFLKLISNKEFESEILKSFISSIYQILNKENLEDNFKTLQSIEDKIIQTNSVIKFYIPYSYFILEKWELSVTTFNKYISKDKESRDLFFFILALERSLSNHKELLELLEFWRINFSFNEELLQIEANICHQLPDWGKCLLISEKFLAKHSTDEFFLVLKLISINELEIKDKASKIKSLAMVFKDFNFKSYTNVQNVYRVLIENKFYQIGLDILYKNASNIENIQARMDYLLAIAQMPEGYINEKEKVELDSYVKYSLEGKVNFIKIQNGNSLAERLIGLHKGESVNIERPIVRNIDTIMVLRIMDKYLSLHDEILEYVKSNPYSDIPLQSFDIKDSSLEGINETFKELFGAQGTIQNEKKEGIFLKYYNFNLSFTELIIQIYNSNYFGGYFNLIRFKEGITQIPMMYYPQYKLKDDVEIVIDFSSLLILYQISREHSVVFEHKFLIAKGVVEYIRNFLKKERLEPRERMSLNITLENVSADIIPEEASRSNVIFLERLLKWIDLNCSEIIVISKLNFIRRLGRKIENDLLINLLIENITLVMESENRILLTDDSIYFRFYPVQSGKTISSEMYLNSTMVDNAEFHLEFVKNKYIGFTYQSSTLIQEFSKKLKGQPNNFAHCISNTALRLIPSKNTILTIIGFLKQIALNPLISDDTFKQESINALVNLLKGQREEKPFQITELLLKKEFKLLGSKLELVLESYSSALLILRVS